MTDKIFFVGVALTVVFLLSGGCLIVGAIAAKTKWPPPAAAARLAWASDTNIVVVIGVGAQGLITTAASVPGGAPGTILRYDEETGLYRWVLNEKAQEQR